MKIWILFILVLSLPGWGSPWSGDGVRFHDIAAGDGAGITYRRTPSQRESIYEPVRELEDFGMTFPIIPVKGRGIPGVALLDYDNDGDLDLYVTNGPGTPNSLYANQLEEMGELGFIDVAVTANVAATGQDSSGVCFGDIDNDGDEDIYVLGTGEANILFRNNGNGTFTDITSSAEVGGGPAWSSSASMGDVNGDGLLDIFVGNFGDFRNSEILFLVPFALNDHNHLFLNMGGNRFRDVSETSGIRDLGGFQPQHRGNPGPTHAVAMVDFDLDGDLDIFTADDQAGVPSRANGNVDRGLIHVFRNDGTGFFEDINTSLGVNHTGAWMGLSLGDYNHDGRMDFFVTNFGIYNGALFSEGNLNQNASRWYLGNAAEGFDRPPLGGLLGTPFGWSTSSSDYDNDGDTDIIFYGGLDSGGFIDLTNPGVFLVNDGNGSFDYDNQALSESTNHSRRVIHGLATGDLNNDGFIDIVSASNFNIPDWLPLEKRSPIGGPFDDTAFFLTTFGLFGNPPAFRYNPGLPDFPNGTLSIEISDGGNDNNWVEISLLGARGLTPAGRVNRDGIGAVITFRPHGRQTALKPVIGGSGYASQHTIRTHFGMGRARWGTLEVLWPGGVRTIVYKVLPGERLLVPELPVSYDENITFSEYRRRIDRVLDDLLGAGLLTPAQVSRIGGSARFAFLSRHCLF